jgi:hypothetical protein
MDSVASGNYNDGIDVVDANVTILNSVMANNAADGLYVTASSIPLSWVTVRNSTATANRRGFAAAGILVLSHSVATRHRVGVIVFGGFNGHGYAMATMTSMPTSAMSWEA